MQLNIGIVMNNLTHLKLGNFNKLLSALENKKLNLIPSALEESKFRKFNLENSLEFMLSGSDLNYIGMVSANHKTDYFVTKVKSEYNEDYSGHHKWDSIEQAIASALIQYDFSPNNLTSVVVKDGKIFFSDEEGENTAEINIINKYSYSDYEEKFTRQVHSKLKGLSISEDYQEMPKKLKKFSGLKKLYFSKIYYMPSNLPLLRSINNFVFYFQQILNKFIKENVTLSMAQEFFVDYYQTCSWHELKRNEKEASVMPFVYQNNNSEEVKELYFKDHASGIYHLNKMLSRDNRNEFRNADFLHSNRMHCMNGDSYYSLDEFSIFKDAALRQHPLCLEKTRAYNNSLKLKVVIDQIILDYNNGKLQELSSAIESYEPEGSLASGWFDHNMIFLLDNEDGKLKIAKENKEFNLIECDYDSAKIKKVGDEIIIYSDQTNEVIVIDKVWSNTLMNISENLGLSSRSSDIEKLNKDDCWDIYNNI